MTPDPFTSWLLSQALGPALVERGLDRLARPDWRERLTSAVTDNMSENISRRRLRRWLARPDTWSDLVLLTPDALERLKESLAVSLRPRLVFRTKRYEPERLRHLAEAAVPVVVGEFLSALDPSYATSVAYYRQMRELTQVRSQVDQVAAALDVDRDLPELMRRLPNPARRPLEDLQRASRIVCASLVRSILVGRDDPAVAVSNLMERPPPWLEDAPPSAWLVLGEVATGHDRRSAAATAFERAADRGAPNRADHLARAACEAKAAEDIDWARELIRRAMDASRDGPGFVDLAAAIVDDDLEAILRVASDFPASSPYAFTVGGIRANVHFFRGEYDKVIALCEEELETQPNHAGLALIRARALLARAITGKSVSSQHDVQEARDAALRARDLRREWLGPSEEAVAVACQACITGHAWEKAISLGLQHPEGEALEREARSQEVLPLVAAAAVAAGRLDVVERVIDQLESAFERALHTVHLHEQQGRPRDELVSEYREAWQLASEPDEQFAVQLGLASLGVWPVPGFDDLAQRQPEEADSVAAMSEAARGLYDEAIRRLRRRGSSPRAQQLLVQTLGQAGRLGQAIQVSRDARSRFDDPLFGELAGRILARAGKLDEASEEVRDSLIGVGEESHAAVELTYLLVELAAERSEWGDAESLARRLSLRDPHDENARWWWVLALFNQGKSDAAWKALNEPETMSPQDKVQAQLWLDLHRRFGEDPRTVQQALDIAAEYEDSEEIRAAALVLAFEKSRDQPIPDVIAERVRTATESFLDEFPESGLFRRVAFEDTDDLLARMRELLEPEARPYEELRKEVVLRWFPYGVLSAFLGRSYAEALLMRAAGCLPQEIDEPGVRDQERATVESASEEEVAIDISTLTALSDLPELWDVFRSLIGRPILATASNRDVQQARANLAQRATTTLSWDVSQGAPVAAEISQETADELAEKAEWVAEKASQLSLVEVRRIDLFPDLDADRWGAPLVTVQMAKDRGDALFASDAGLRLLARAHGVKAFGIGAFIEFANARSQIATPLASLNAKRRRKAVVDLPTTKEDVLQEAEEDGWAVGPASFVLTRAAFWRAPREALETYKSVCSYVAARNRSALPRWLGSAIQGAGQGRISEDVVSLAGALMAYATMATDFDPDSFPFLLEAARRSTNDLEAGDPLPASMGLIVQSLRETFHPQIAAQFALGLARNLSSDDRETSLRIILEARPHA